MARGIGDVEGWPAVEWVAGMGAVVLLTAGFLWYRARSFHDRPAVPPTYRVAGAPGSSDGGELRAISLLVVAIGMASQLLYLGVYLELAQWLLGARERPRLSGDLFFWVLLVNGTCAGASLYTAIRKAR
jgi:hypothetical protein